MGNTLNDIGALLPKGKKYTVSIKNFFMANKISRTGSLFGSHNLILVDTGLKVRCSSMTIDLTTQSNKTEA